MRLYMAGPLFTVAEKHFNEVLAGELAMLGHEVWLPQDRAPQKLGSAQEIFDSNVDGLNWCEAVVACVDGADADSGTCWEMGYTYAMRKPVVAYRSDFRPAGDDKWVNLMLSKSANILIRCEGMTIQLMASFIHEALMQGRR